MVPTGLRHDTAQASVVERAVLPTKRLKAWLDQELRQLFPARRGNGLELLGHEQLYGGYAAGHLHPVLLSNQMRISCRPSSPQTFSPPRYPSTAPPCPVSVVD